jgi:hypothetical protein
MDTLRTLCVVLSSESVSPDDAARALNATEEYPDDAGNLIVIPADPDFSRAAIVGSVDSPGTPAHVTLSVSEGREIPVESLKKSFGDFRIVPAHRPRDLPQIIFYPDLPGQPHSCAVIADVQASGGDLDAGVAKSVTLRRDKRSE